MATAAALGALSALYVAVIPAGDQTPLADRTWEQVAAADAEVASIVSRLLVVLGLLGVGVRGAESGGGAGAVPPGRSMGLVRVVADAAHIRRDRRSSTSDQYPIGYFYAALAAVAGIGLLLEIPRIRRKPGVESGRPAEG